MTNYVRNTASPARLSNQVGNGTIYDVDGSLDGSVLRRFAFRREVLIVPAVCWRVPWRVRKHPRLPLFRVRRRRPIC